MKKIKHTSEECNALEGNEIHFVSGHYDQTGVIVSCDPDVGIVVVDKVDKKDQLVCLPGPLTKEFESSGGMSENGHYNDLFDMYVEQLEKKEFLTAEIDSILTTENPSFTIFKTNIMHNCPLS